MGLIVWARIQTESKVEDTNRSYDIAKLEGEQVPHFIVPRIEEISYLLEFHFEIIGTGSGENNVT